MKNGSYADLVMAAKTMIAGLQSNQARLSKWGVSQTFLDEFTGIYREVLTLDNEQQALKSRLKEKTAAMNEGLTAMQKMYGTSKKLVKIEMARESWKEFGIPDIQ